MQVANWYLLDFTRKIDINWSLEITTEDKLKSCVNSNERGFVAVSKQNLKSIKNSQKIKNYK